MRDTVLATLILLAICAPPPARSAALQGSVAVDSTTLAFRPGDTTQFQTISNPGDAPVRVQVRLFRWHNQGTDDRYEPSQDIGFSPAIFDLPPGARQIVRLAVTEGRAAGERAYRLFIDQLPAPSRSGTVMLPVRLLIPVFVGSEEDAAPNLSWRATVDSAGNATLTATNVGGTRARLTDLFYEADGEKHVIAAGLAGYVLSGEQHAWVFRVPPAARTIRITGKLEQGEVAASVALNPG